MKPLWPVPKAGFACVEEYISPNYTTLSIVFLLHSVGVGTHIGFSYSGPGNLSFV